MDISGMKVQMGFSLKSPQPLDARSVVETKDDLDSLVSSSWAYDGMVVYVKTGDDKGLYVYEANETSGVWTKVGSGEGGSIDPSVLENYYTKDDVDGLLEDKADSSDLDSYIPKTGFSMRSSSSALKFYYSIDGKETAVTVKSPTIPSSTSQLNNDSGFVTKADAAPQIIDLTE